MIANVVVLRKPLVASSPMALGSGDLKAMLDDELTVAEVITI